MKPNLIGIGFVFGAIAGVLFNSIFSQPFDASVQTLLVTSLVGIGCGALLARNK